MKKVLKRVEIVLIIISVFAFINGLLILLFYSHVNSDNIITFSKLSFVPASNNYFSPNIRKNDLALIEEKDLSDYHINNIIAYYTSDFSGNIVVTIGKIMDGYANAEGTSYIFMVQSDKDSTTTIDGDDVIGKWEGNRIRNGSKITKFIFSRIGFIVICVFPLVIIFGFEFALLIKDYLNRKR
ncbi:MAG: hypothetical protein IJ193_07395 [Bacilli bacterium]|nr:hypothetical protein [Bacilli bacterium]